MRTLSLALLCLTLGASSASALGKFGVRAGTGTSFYDSDVDDATEPDITPFAAGLAWRFDQALLGVEVNALWWQNSIEMDLDALGTFKATETRLALPLIGRINFPIVPLVLDLNVGGGLEPRFLISTEDENGKDLSDDAEMMVLYMPIAVGATINAGPLGVQVDLRYERQITEHNKENKDKVHQIMLFGGVFF